MIHESGIRNCCDTSYSRGGVPNEELFIQSRCLSSNIISIKILDFSNLCKIIHHSKLRDIEIISSTVHDMCIIKKRLTNVDTNRSF
jgi:hypothetical protein